MRSQVVAFVDAGFLRRTSASALARLHGARITEAQVRIDHQSFVEFVRSTVDDVADQAAFLRAYWYDGVMDPAEKGYRAQRQYLDTVASTTGIQLRLGYMVKRTESWHRAVAQAVQACGIKLEEFRKHFEFRNRYEQKGVDTLLVLDLVRLAERGVYETAILFSGDRDLAEAVRAAQNAGCSVVLVHPEGSAGGVATELQQLADQVITVNDKQVALFANHVAHQSKLSLLDTGLV